MENTMINAAGLYFVTEHNLVKKKFRDAYLRCIAELLSDADMDEEMKKAEEIDPKRVRAVFATVLASALACGHIRNEKQGLVVKLIKDNLQDNEEAEDFSLIMPDQDGDMAEAVIKKWSV